MKKISSNFTFVYKIIIPIGWCIVLAVAIIAYINQFQNQDTIFSLKDLLLRFSFFLISAYFIYYLVFRTKSEVYDLGNGLLIKDKNQQIKILDENIKDVTYTRMKSPTTVTVYLKNPIELGQKFSFIGKRNTGFFMTENPDIENIIKRIQTTS